MNATKTAISKNRRLHLTVHPVFIRFMNAEIMPTLCRKKFPLLAVKKARFFADSTETQPASSPV
jgi:hypothetical protein